MYKIIGADQKEYGPITADQIRRWIAEGRVNGRTQARLESATDWQPLSAFPEFADLLGRPAPGGAPPVPGAVSSAVFSGSHEAAATRLRGPAIGLIVTASINLLFAVWGLFAGATGSDLSSLEEIPDPEMQRMVKQIVEVAEGPIGMVSDLLHLVVSGVILAGGIQMLKLRSHGLAMWASILALIPCITPCCAVITLPFGIWALVTMNNPEVKSHYS